MATISDLTNGVSARLLAGFEKGMLWPPNQAALAAWRAFNR